MLILNTTSKIYKLVKYNIKKCAIMYVLKKT